MNSKSKNVKTILVTLLIEIILAAILTLATVLVTGYIIVNLETLTNLTFVNYAYRWEKLWIMIFYLSDFLFYIIISLIFIELILFVLRKMILTGIKAVETIKNVEFKKAQEVVKTISLISIFKAMKINTPKRSIIAYVILMVVVFGSGWVAKTVLKANDSLVYRSYEIINLYNDEQIIDFKDELTDDQRYQILIDTDVANIHLYTVSSTTDAKFYYLYDTEAQKQAYTIDIDEELNIITIVLDQNLVSYEKYVDPVLPSIEIYLPSTIKIDLIDVSISTYGSLTMEYVTFGDLVVDSHHADLTITGEGVRVNSIDINQYEGELQLIIDHSDDVTLVLDQVKSSIRLNLVENDLLVHSIYTDLFIYQTDALSIDITSLDSSLELREVVGDTVTMDLDASQLLYVNSSGNMTTVATIVSNDSVLTLRGVTNDQDSE